MKKLFVVTLVYTILYVLPLSASAEKLSIATTEWHPYLIMDNGKPTGIFTEIALEVCKRLGIDAEIKIVPWARAVKYVKEGTSDALLGPKKTEDRIETMFFPSEPMYMEELVIMAMKGSNIKAEKIEDLEGKKIGVVRDYSYGTKFDDYQGMKKIVCDDDEQAVKILEKGRVEIIAGDKGNLRFLAKKMGIKTGLETVYLLTKDPDYIAFSKKALGEKGKELAEKFSEVLRQLKKEDFVEKVESKYF